MPSLLCVCPHFPPSAASGSFRMLGFARHLPALSWNVSVVYGTKNPREPVDLGLARLVPCGVETLPVPFPATGRHSRSWWNRRLTGRQELYTLWTEKAAESARWLLSSFPFDAILTSGPPHCVHDIGVLAKREFSIPWIADFRDPWSVPKTPFGWARRLQRLHSTTWEHADLILANAPRSQSAMLESKARFAAKVLTIPNGFDPQDYTNLRPHEYGFDGITLCHAGELYHGRDPAPVLKALAALQATNDATGVAQIVCLGRESDSTRELGASARNMGLERQVRFEGQQSFHETRRHLLGADILLLLDTPGRLAGVPAKLYEYLGAARPILALAEENGDTADVLSRCGVEHRRVPTDDPRAVADAIQQLSQFIRTGAPTVHEEKCRLQFTRLEAAKKLVQALNQLTGQRAAAPTTH